MDSRRSDGYRWNLVSGMIILSLALVVMTIIFTNLTISCATPVKNIYCVIGTAILMLLISSIAFVSWREKGRSERKLKIITDEYSYLFEKNKMGVVFEDTENRIIKANKSACDILGLPLDQLIGKALADPFWSFAHEDGSVFRSDELPSRVALKSGRPVNNAVIGFCKQDSSNCIWLMINCIPVYSNKNHSTPKIVITTFTDITQQKNTESKLTANDAFVSIIFDKNEIGIFVVKVSDVGVYRFEKINPAFERLLGINNSQIADKTPDDLVEHLGVETVNQIKNLFTSCIQKKESASMEYNIPYGIAKGWWLLGLTPLIDNSTGKVEKLIGSGISITERKQAEDELRKEKWRLTNVIEATRVGTWEWNVQTSEVSCNEMWAQSIGYTLKELSPVNAKVWEELIYPEDLNHINELFDMHFKGKLPYYENEFRMRHKNGSYIWVQSRGKVITWTKEGKPLLMAGAHFDITARKEAEEKLVHSQKLMRYVIEHNWGGTAVFDKDMRYVYVSQTFLSDFDAKDTNIIGKTHYEIFPDIPPKWKDLHRRALSGEELRAENDPFVRSDGSIVWTRWEMRPWFEADGSIGGIVVYAENITQRKKTENELREVREKLQFALSASHIGAWDLDLADDTIFHTLEHDQIYGYATLLPKWTYEIFLSHVYDDDKKMVDSLFKKAIKEHGNWDVECRIIRQDGKVRWIRENGKHLKEQDGTYRHMAGIVQDITEKKLNEEALKNYTQRLQNLHYADQAILLATESVSQIIQTALQHVCQMLRCWRSAIIIFGTEKRKGLLISCDKCGKVVMPQDLTNLLFEKSENLLLGKPDIVEDIEKENLPETFVKDMSEEKIRSYLNYPLIAGEELIGILNVSRKEPHSYTAEEMEVAQEVANQITIAIEQRRLRDESKQYASELEERVRDRTAQLEAANRELEAFSYSVSHDLRAPLRAVDGFTRMLVDQYGSRLDNEGTRICTIIRDSAKNMSKLIDDLLAFSRAGRTRLAYSIIDMKSLVEKVYMDIVAPQDQKRIKFTVGELPRASGDPNLIYQVMTNLLSNAIKFSSKRDIAVIRIDARLENEMVVFSVQDNGAGFDMKYTDKLFGVFERLHSTKEFEGTGVGLAIVQRIIERHGGKVWAIGEINKGATFFFTLKKGG